MPYTNRAMTRHSIPPSSPHQKTFRVFLYGSIALMLVALALSHNVPIELSDSISHPLGWTMVALLCISVAGASILAAKQGSWKLKQSTQFDFSAEKITRLREGWPPIEIPLTQIKRLQEYRGGLLVAGDEPLRGFTVPREINEFEEVKRKLASYGEITPSQLQISYRAFLLVFVMLIAYAFLFFSKTPVVVLSAGIVVLLLQGSAFFSLRPLWARTSQPRLMLFVYLFSWLILAWLVYQRVSAATPFVGA